MYKTNCRILLVQSNQTNLSGMTYIISETAQLANTGSASLGMIYIWKQTQVIGKIPSFYNLNLLSLIPKFLITFDRTISQINCKKAHTVILVTIALTSACDSN